MALFDSRSDVMCLHDLMVFLRENGLEITETQVRWAIKSGKVTRPPLDGSLRFDFRDEHVGEIVHYFTNRFGRKLKGRDR
jgi:hypothetical protein